MLRIGTLGAARITPMALLGPALHIDGLWVEGLAARDQRRAQKFAHKHGIPRVCSSYQALLEDPEIDAIYIPLPNGLHCEWTIKALQAGKHVLCEKPFANNAREARAMVEAAAGTGLTLMEAFHYRHHPLMARVRELLPSLGKLSCIETRMCVPLPLFKDIRYNFELGGGSKMDVGAYSGDMLRQVAAASGDPALASNPEVVRATPVLLNPNVDRAMEVELAWPNGCQGYIRNSLWSRHLLSISLRAVGEEGELRVSNPVAPQLWHRLTLKRDGLTQREKVTGKGSYYYQLLEFQRRIVSGEGSADLGDSIATMELIDSIYEAAGMPLRGTSA